MAATDKKAAEAKAAAEKKAAMEKAAADAKAAAAKKIADERAKAKQAEEEKRIKKNRDLQALMQLRQRNAPDVSDEVSRERGEDIQIHDGFGAMESKDQEEEKRIK